jgi:hypothetical protein
MGRFAEYYRELFGELPSATLSEGLLGRLGSGLIMRISEVPIGINTRAILSY